MIQTKDYNIVFGNQAFSALHSYLVAQHYSKIFVLVDENTLEHCYPILKSVLSEFELALIEIPSGEPHKNIQSCQQIWSALLAQKADRKSLLLNLGGGVIGDMGGFCAATFKRGMDFIQIPTTLLSQVDASVGGKLGIDFDHIKNAIGLFQHPKMVCIYPQFLATLPKRELYSGYAEIIKHALIADADYWQELQTLQKVEIENTDWASIIRHSIGIKHSVVEEDPLEKGKRKILNFGHSIGHAIESLSWETDYPLLHGEAIAIGMICEAYLSVKLLKLPESAVRQIEAYILSLYPAYDIARLPDNRLLELMHQDKKNEGRQMSFSLISAIGQAEINIHVSDDLMLESLSYYSHCTKAEQ